MRLFHHVGIAFLTGMAAGWASPHGLKVTGASLGFGNWAVETEGVANSCEDYGTWPSLGLYLGSGSWTGSLTLPWRTSYKKSVQETRLSPGDFKLSLGRKAGWVTPRATLQFPLYRWSVENASVNELFIGSGNVDAGIGMGFKLFQGMLPKTLSAGGDFEISTAVMAALADYGSVHAQGTLGLDYSFAKRWKIGLSSLFLFDHWRWIPDYWDQQTETKFSVVPGILIGTRMWKATYLNLKGGISAYSFSAQESPRFPIRPKSSHYFSGSLFQGF